MPNRVRLAKFLVKLGELQHQKGHILNKKNSNLEISYKILVQNYCELMIHIKDTPTFSVERREENDRFQLEALRRLVNLLNSITSHTSHMRNYARSLKDEEDAAFFELYSKEVKRRFSSNDLVRFLEALRNFYDHVDILPLGIVTRAKGDNLYSRTVLFKSGLIERDDDFNKKAKGFLNEAEEHIDILDICDQYIQLSLFPWFMRQQGALYKNHFNELKSLQEELSALLEG